MPFGGPWGTRLRPETGSTPAMGAPSVSIVPKQIGLAIPLQRALSQPGGDQSFAALRSLMRHHWVLMVVTTLIRVFAVVFTAVQPYFLARLVTSANDKDEAFRFLLLFLGSGIAHTVVWSTGDYVNSRWITPLAYEMKTIAFNTVWAKPYRSFVDHPSGKVGSYVNDIRENVSMLWDLWHYTFLPLAAAVPVWAYLLMRESTSNTVGYGVFMVVAAFVLARLAKPLARSQRELTNRQASNNGHVFDSFANFVNVFSFRGQPKEIARNDGDIDGLIPDARRAEYFLTNYWTAASVLMRVGLWTGVLLYGWYQYDQGTISFTALVISASVLNDVTSQYWNVVHSVGTWVNRSAAYREAYTYLFDGENIVDKWIHESDSARTNQHKVLTLGSGMEIRGLCFAYPDAPDQLVLDHIDLRIGRGEKVGVVGRSGEGKSTLTKILLGFYEPTQGEVLVDGKPVKATDLSQLQTYVPQDTSLFQQSIRYNIAYADNDSHHINGDDNAELERVREAAEKAKIAEFVDSMPEQYETLVGERGIKLSLGQRQRIAIARAFLKPAELLILDEATSSLDSETEAMVQAGLEELWHDKAAIIIAHRLATLNNVDRIVVIEAGRVAEQGTKDELLASDGIFAELWGRQRAGMLADS